MKIYGELTSLGFLLYIYTAINLLILSKFISHKIFREMTIYTIAFVLASYCINNRQLDYRKPDYLLVLGLMLIIIIVFDLIVLKYIRKAQEQKDSIGTIFKPMFIFLIFITSYITGINATGLHLPWFTGYILVTLSFITGLILFRNNLNFRKKERSN